MCIKIFIPPNRENTLSNSLPDKTVSDLTNNYNLLLAYAVNQYSSLKLPIFIKNKEVSYQVDPIVRTRNIVIDNSKIDVDVAASGIKSVLPVYLTLTFIQHELERLKKNIDDPNPLALNYINNSKLLSTRDIARKDTLEKQYLSKSPNVETAIRQASREVLPDGCFSVIDEAETSLFPENQKNFLYALLSLTNNENNNSFVLPTHSPYIVYYVGLATKAYQIVQKLEAEGRMTAEVKAKIDAIVPESARIPLEEVRIYSFEDGRIELLEPENDAITDNFSLNIALEELSNNYDDLFKLYFNNKR